MILLASALFVVTACQESLMNADNNSPANGKLVVKLTDAPFPVDLIDKALVTIDKIEIRQADNHQKADTLKADNKKSDEDMEVSSFIVISEKTQQFNLLDLRNGITADLLEMTIDTGTYDLIRMHVVEGKIILKDGTTFNLKIPGDKSGSLKIKIDPELVVKDGVTNEVLLDFDVSKSFIIQGNIKAKKGIKGFLFNPVIRAVSQNQCASVQGKVKDSKGAPIELASVQILKGDSILTSSITDKKGEYTMIGIPAGTYKMICEKEGYKTVNIDKIQIESKHKTTQNFDLNKE